MTLVNAAGSERGAATLLATVFAALLTVVALVCAVLGGVLADHRRAAAAADLAALAGATAAQHHQPPCPAAHEVAEANGAALESCTVHGEEILVEAAVATRLPVVGARALSAEARAGPVGRS